MTELENDLLLYTLSEHNHPHLHHRKRTQRMLSKRSKNTSLRQLKLSVKAKLAFSASVPPTLCLGTLLKLLVSYFKQTFHCYPITYFKFGKFSFNNVFNTISHILCPMFVRYLSSGLLKMCVINMTGRKFRQCELY